MRLFKKNLLRFAILTLLLSAVACAASKDGHDKVIAKVGGRTITLAQYQEALKRLVPEGDALGADIVEIKRDLIKQLIEEELILNEAQRLNVSVSEEEITSEVERLKQEYGTEPFKDSIATRYGDMDKWKNELKRRLLVKKTVLEAVNPKAAPTEDEARRYYEEHMEDYDVAEQVHARMIVVGSEDTARGIRARLKPGNFADIAREASLSPEGKNGGDLGFFSRGDMPEEFENAVFKLKAGEISPVVKTEYGYHIFFVEARRKRGRLKFDSVKGRIMEKLASEKADEEFGIWLDGLKEGARIEVKEDLL